MARRSPIRLRGLLAALALVPLVACRVADPVEMPQLAHARVTTDFATYELRRVGVMPFAGEDVLPARARELQIAFFTELSRTTPYELVLLDPDDVAETEPSEPYRRGWYRPRTIIQVARRYNLDAILFGTVTHERFFPPLELGLQTDLVAAETGLVIWSSTLNLDASDPLVADGLRLYFADEDPQAPHDWRLAFLSPERFARFAAFQVAILL